MTRYLSSANHFFYKVDRLPHSEQALRVSFRQNLTFKGRFAVRRKRSSIEQIVGVLKQAEVGLPVIEVCRQQESPSRPSIGRRSSMWGLEVDQVRQLKQFQEENTRLEQLVADLMLDKAMLQDVLSKKF
jgi:putative transposase